MPMSPQEAPRISDVIDFVNKKVEQLMKAEEQITSAISWDHEIRRSGFKFLTIRLTLQNFCSDSCFPGAVKEDPHKQLFITRTEWDIACCIARQAWHAVCREFGSRNRQIWHAVFDGFRSLVEAAALQGQEEHCIRSMPDGSHSLFLRLGGAYPIALFVERLFESVVSKPSAGQYCNTQLDNAISLKYFLTETICGAAGGFSLSARPFFGLRALMSREQMTRMLNAAKKESDHFGSGFLRKDLIMCLYESQHLFIGAKLFTSNVTSNVSALPETSYVDKLCKTNRTLSKAAAELTSSLALDEAGDMAALGRTKMDTQLKTAIQNAREPAKQAGMDSDMLCRKAKQTFQAAILNSRLKAFSSSQQQHPWVQAPREHVSVAEIFARTNAMLDRTRCKVSCSSTVEEQTAPMQQSVLTAPIQAAPMQASEIDSMRQEIKTTLQSSLLDGRLSEVVEGIRMEQEAKELKAKRDHEAKAQEHLRLDMRMTFQSSLADGRFMDVLSGMMAAKRAKQAAIAPTIAPVEVDTSLDEVAPTPRPVKPTSAKTTSRPVRRASALRSSVVTETSQALEQTAMLPPRPPTPAGSKKPKLLLDDGFSPKLSSCSRPASPVGRLPPVAPPTRKSFQTLLPTSRPCSGSSPSTQSAMSLDLEGSTSPARPSAMMLDLGVKKLDSARGSRPASPSRKFSKAGESVVFLPPISGGKVWGGVSKQSPHKRSCSVESALWGVAPVKSHMEWSSGQVVF